MCRAEAQTALQRGDVRAISAGGSASGGSDAALSVARRATTSDARGWRCGRRAPRRRRHVDARERRAPGEHHARRQRRAVAAPRGCARDAAATRRDGVRDASASFDASRSPFSPRPRRKGHPNAAWYADRLDDALEGEADASRTSRTSRTSHTSRTREYPDTSASRVMIMHGRLARLFNEARAVGCPPNASDVARAVKFLAETTTTNDTGVAARLGDACLADASERAVDAALRLAWTFFRPPEGDADDGASDLGVGHLGVGAAATVVAAAARRGGHAGGLGVEAPHGPRAEPAARAHGRAAAPLSRRDGGGCGRRASSPTRAVLRASRKILARRRIIAQKRRSVTTG